MTRLPILTLAAVAAISFTPFSANGNGAQQTASQLRDDNCKVTVWQNKAELTKAVKEKLEALGLEVENDKNCAIIIKPGNKPSVPKPPSSNTPETPEQNQPETEAPDSDKPVIPEEKPTNPSVPDLPTLPDIPTVPDQNQPETPEQETTTAPDQNENLSYAEQVVSLVNEQRKNAGLSELAFNKEVSSAAMVRAQEIQTSFSHTRPNGTSFSTVLKDNGISFRSAGENIAWGQRTPKQVMNAWMNSQGHRANILNSNFSSIGVAYVQSPSGTPYWVQLFIR